MDKIHNSSGRKYLTISGKVNKKNQEGNALGISIDLNNKSLFSENLVLFIDSYKISFNEINLDNDKMILIGDPIYLKDNDGTVTTTSSIEIMIKRRIGFPKK